MDESDLQTAMIYLGINEVKIDWFVPGFDCARILYKDFSTTVSYWNENFHNGNIENFHATAVTMTQDIYDKILKHLLGSCKQKALDNLIEKELAEHGVQIG